VHETNSGEAANDPSTRDPRSASGGTQVIAKRSSVCRRNGASGQERRKHPRRTCCIATEMRETANKAPVWGNVRNTSEGGCYVETPAPVVRASEVEIGVSTIAGTMWVTGTVIRNDPGRGIAVRFYTDTERRVQEVKTYLEWVERTTTAYEREHGYLAELKRK
jgi:PilZ domain